MGQYKDSKGLEAFEPDNTESTLFVDASTYTTWTLQDILNKVREHFGNDVSLDQIRINADHIQTRCIGYDLYDPGDYDDYIVLTMETSF